MINIRNNQQGVSHTVAFIFIVVIGLIGVIALRVSNAEQFRKADGTTVCRAHGNNVRAPKGQHCSITRNSSGVHCFINGSEVKCNPNHAAGSTDPGPSSGSLKPLISGLLDRHGLPDGQFQKVVNGYVIQVNWADLQPTKGGPISANNVIDQAISTVQQLNKQDPNLGMQLKLRVYTGINAPNWAKNLDGAPVEVNAPNSDASHSGTVGRFWTDNYMSAYRDLEAKLAAKYDSEPDLLEVSVSGCTTIFEEPLLRQAGDAASVNGLLQAGYTADLDARCQHSQIDAMKVWHQTHISMAFNPYQHINSDASFSVDEAFTETIMAYCRQTLGPQCVLENNSIRDTSNIDGSPYGQMYGKMKTIGKPILFQTATEAKVGDLLKTIDFAVSEGAGAVELPSGYKNSFTPDQLSPYDQKLENN